MDTEKEINCDLAVVGAGMTGMAASLFAANRGIDTIQIGVASQIIFSSGFLDLLGVHPVEEGKTWDDPFEALDQLAADQPDHPYARIPKNHILKSFQEVTAFLAAGGLVYQVNEGRNTRVITSLGTVKPTYGVPRTMWNGARALEEKQPGLIIDIKGLRGFSARQITETLKPVWPDLRHAGISFPDMQSAQEMYTEPMARSLAVPENRKKLADLIRPLAKDVGIVGVPAILGMQDSQHVQQDLEERVGLPLFEIPTMPPSIPGLRIRETFEMKLPEKGVRLQYQNRVSRISRDKGAFLLEIGSGSPVSRVRARGVILATGRFLGKGLSADRKRIREPLLNLPVYQPGVRPEWHRFDFMDPRGHLINRAGLEIDNRFRPLDTTGQPVFDHLFAAGSILAHQDWMRMKCGSGLAMATAYAAVNAFLENAEH
jgi:glycerol-3-phosphate dehydrogenase subunit B